ncbi:MAG: hypothetical protein GY750_04215 [Lentisphaerae bacterium]|nr:hypothetical protein [Lentisphaerota bacterium]MCP4100616.1 hypothetical protein [Lentisphaerota bacterium]
MLFIKEFSNNYINIEHFASTSDNNSHENIYENLVNTIFKSNSASYSYALLFYLKNILSSKEAIRQANGDPHFLVLLATNKLFYDAGYNYSSPGYMGTKPFFSKLLGLSTGNEESKDYNCFDTATLYIAPI